MSTSYNIEPPTTAEVILHTSAGPIPIELFGKQAPLATQNFLQHCLDGYYDNTIFHRLVPGFIIQGGDPTGLGTGGESAITPDGRPFEDEFHQRLKYNRRGLVGMANSGGKDENASQFFVTLGPTPELNNKNTLFGRVTTEGIYVVLKMSEMEIAEGSDDRPLYPAKVERAEIVVNPFDGMVRRSRSAVESTTTTVKTTKKKKKAKRALLSFGDEEDELDEIVASEVRYNVALVAPDEALEEKERRKREKREKKGKREKKEKRKKWREEEDGLEDEQMDEDQDIDVPEHDGGRRTDGTKVSVSDKRRSDVELSDSESRRPKRRRADTDGDDYGDDYVGSDVDAPPAPPSRSRSRTRSRSRSTSPRHRNRNRISGRDRISDRDTEAERESRLASTKAQIEALKSQIRGRSPDSDGEHDTVKPGDDEDRGGGSAVAAGKESSKNGSGRRDRDRNGDGDVDPFEAMIPKTAIRGRKRRGGGRVEESTKAEGTGLSAFLQFKQKLAMAESSGASSSKAGSKDVDPNDVLEEGEAGEAVPDRGTGEASVEAEETTCDLHFVTNCQSCRNWDDQVRDRIAADEAWDDADLGWMTHQLTFEQDRVTRQDRWRRANEVEVTVLDPREAEDRGGRGGGLREVGGSGNRDRNRERERHGGRGLRERR